METFNVVSYDGCHRMGAGWLYGAKILAQRVARILSGICGHHILDGSRRHVGRLLRR